MQDCHACEYDLSQVQGDAAIFCPRCGARLVDPDELTVALGVGLVVILFLTSRIVRPIRLLVQGTKEIMDGNYDYTVDNRSRDEIGQLTRAFNHMTGGLKEKEQIRSLFGKYVHPSMW